MLLKTFSTFLTQQQKNVPRSFLIQEEAGLGCIVSKVGWLNKILIIFGRFCNKLMKCSSTIKILITLFHQLQGL
jgi:hypothetical protein